MDKSFLVTVCGWCNEQYFVIEVGKGHGCAASQNPKIEKIQTVEASSTPEPMTFGGSRRVRGY